MTGSAEALVKWVCRPSQARGGTMGSTTWEG
jgi:hypothetical protein